MTRPGTPPRTLRIALIPGDGIGAEVMAEAARVLRAVVARDGVPTELTEWDLGAERYLRDGVAISDDEFRSLAGEYDAILLGAFGDPRVEDQAHAREILLGLRVRLDLYINYRPCRLLDPSLTPLRSAAGTGFDVEIFRENTEGSYVNLGGTFKEGTPQETAIQEAVHTYRGVERIVRAAFERATDRDRPLVTMVDKANALPHAGRLWRRVFREVGAEFPGVDREVLHADVAAMDLVRRPDELSVLVTSNLFGDILSDLGAQLSGGPGLAPSANLHPGRHALFEPVHGSAPDLAGTGTANPLAAIRCTALLLDYFGYREASRSVDEAVHASVRAGVTTPDLGGSHGTEAVGSWIAAAAVEND